mmetsp:Transcript_17771/g.46376  ORF Transcript_17771/g.46376 Transcript_17771/m.46376 type:complete len:232 (+) Transcript_17771:273-968(+)
MLGELVPRHHTDDAVFSVHDWNVPQPEAPKNGIQPHHGGVGHQCDRALVHVRCHVDKERFLLCKGWEPHKSVCDVLNVLFAMPPVFLHKLLVGEGPLVGASVLKLAPPHAVFQQDDELVPHNDPQHALLHVAIDIDVLLNNRKAVVRALLENLHEGRQPHHLWEAHHVAAHDIRGEKPSSDVLGFFLKQRNLLQVDVDVVNAHVEVVTNPLGTEKRNHDREREDDIVGSLH